MSEHAITEPASPSVGPKRARLLAVGEICQPDDFRRGGGGMRLQLTAEKTGRPVQAEWGAIYRDVPEPAREVYPPGTDMRLLQKGEIIAASDVLANGERVPAEIVNDHYLAETPIFRGVGLGEPQGEEGPTGISGPSCPPGVNGPAGEVRGNSFFGEPGPTGTVGCSCAGAAGVDLQPGEQLVDWLGDGGAPWGKCAGCGAPFTKAGGLPGNLCVRCSKQPATFLEALRAATPEKRAAAIALFNRPAGCICDPKQVEISGHAGTCPARFASKNDELAAFATLRTELAGAAVAVDVCTVEQESGEASGNYRILEPGEVIQAGDEYRISAGGKWYAVEPGSQMNGQKAPFTVVFRRAVQGGVGLYEEAAMAAAVDNFGQVAPEPWLSNWDRLMRWLFPPLYVPTPEAPAEWKDVLHLDTVLKAPVVDRLRFLVSGRLHVRSVVVCQNEIGKSIAHTSAAALAPGKGRE